MLTEKEIRKLFTELNDAYFNGRLPQPDKIVFKFVKGFLGQFHYDYSYSHPFSSCEIRFSTAWQMTDEEIEKVLIHEMVHEWQWVNNYRCGHGPSFKKKAAEINRRTNNRYMIARFTNIENKICLKSSFKSKYCNRGMIAYERIDYPGKILVACCKEEKLKYFKRWFSECNNVRNPHYYIVKEDKAYSRFRVSRKRVNGYVFSPDDYKTNFANTIIEEI